jgi:hypothetical protein
MISFVHRALMALLVLGMVLGCSEQRTEGLGDRIQAPFDIVRVNKWSGDFLVLNAAYDVRFDSGSIQRVGLSAEGALQKKQRVDVPRLGNRMALKTDESLLAVGFSGDRARLSVFSVGDDSLNATPLVSVEPNSDLIITDLSWVQTNVGGSSIDLLLVELGGSNRAGKVVVYRYSDGRLDPAFTVPDDLPNARNPVYELGHSSPVFVQSSNLLAFFPSDGLGRLGNRPSPYDVLKSETWESTSDPRAVSLVVVDLETLFAGELSPTRLEENTGYVPLALNDSLNPPDFDLPANDPANSSVKFKTQFTEAAVAKGPGCQQVVGDQPDDLVLAALFGSGHVVGLSGWSSLKAALTERISGDKSPSKRLLTKNLKIGPYSLGDGAGDLPSGLYRVTQMRSVPLPDASTCLPLISRAEVKTTDGVVSNTGRETVWLSHSLNREPSNPFASRLPERSALRFDGLAQDLLFVSFSGDAIVKAQLGNDGTVAYGTLFQERD